MKRFLAMLDKNKSWGWWGDGNTEKTALANVAKIAARDLKRPLTARERERIDILVFNGRKSLR